MNRALWATIAPQNFPYAKRVDRPAREAAPDAEPSPERTKRWSRNENLNRESRRLKIELL